MYNALMLLPAVYMAFMEAEHGEGFMKAGHGEGYLFWEHVHLGSVWQ